MSTHEELRSLNELGLRAIPELINKNFFIPSYQRGYRWNKENMKQLIEDLDNYFSGTQTSSFYCLQPVVVRELSEEEVNKFELCSETDSNKWYEVIDGQQRLTAIYIILKLIKSLFHVCSKGLFNIHYETRKDLKNYLASINVETKNENYQCAKFENKEPKDNIDSWNIYESANEILKFFQEKNRHICDFMGEFQQKFQSGCNDNETKSVQIIWYELKDGTDPYEMFIRLNDKKIPLNNAELIRCLFLSNSAELDYDYKFLDQIDDEGILKKVKQRELLRKQSHIIEHWDLIEQHLRDEKFWAFIYKDNNYKHYSCRIEYLFDLIANKTDKNQDHLFTYLYFEKNKKKESLWPLWIKVENYFYLLSSWFKDVEYYNRIGFLITIQGPEVLIDLLNKASEQNKKEFKEYIFKKISISIHNQNKPKNILELTYEEDSKLLEKVLFLYNIETHLKNTTFFPFDKYKSANWSIEHIHAQNSEMIDRNDKQKWLDWFDENINALSRLNNRLKNDNDQEGKLSDTIDYLKNSRDTAEKDDKYSFDDFTSSFNMVLTYFDNLYKDEKASSVIHGITNLTLLNVSINSSISNSVFEVKRQRIIKEDANGTYIPICTRNVFLKYYNKDNKDFTVQQNFYWSEKDRNNYLRDIKKTLEEYINAENSDSTK